MSCRFGPHVLSSRQVFFETVLTRAFVNIKPITAGKLSLLFPNALFYCIIISIYLSINLSIYYGYYSLCELSSSAEPLHANPNRSIRR